MTRFSILLHESTESLSIDKIFDVEYLGPTDFFDALALLYIISLSKHNSSIKKFPRVQIYPIWRILSVQRPLPDYANYLNILSTAVCHNHRHIFSHFVFSTQQWNKSFYQKFQLLFTLFAFWYYSHNSYSTLDHKIIWQGGFCYVAINFNFPLINFLEKSQRNLFQQTCMKLY